MRIELSQQQRCCCCLSLRRGLLLWVYLKLVFEILALMYFTFFFLTANVPRGQEEKEERFYYVVASIGLVLIVIDIAFSILFIISAHRKKHEHMRIYYRYAFVMLILGIIALLRVIGMELYICIVSMPPFTFLFVVDLVQFTNFLFMNLVLHACLVILVRSEALKLEKGAKFQFINYTSEPVCKAEIII